MPATTFALRLLTSAPFYFTNLTFVHFASISFLTRPREANMHFQQQSLLYQLPPAHRVHTYRFALTADMLLSSEPIL
jgi:hypothetical protein